MRTSGKLYVHHFATSNHVNFFLFVFLKCLTVTSSSDLPESFSPTKNFLVNCGASGKLTGLDGREWIGDIGQKFFSSPESNDGITASKGLDTSSSTDTLPYQSVRIFRSQLTYSFLVSSGQKFIRLYFDPTSSQELDRSKAFFNVTVGPFSLLSNFSPSLTADHLGTDSFVKEFCINVDEGQILNMTFTPSTSNDVYGFINGIEIVSMPTNLYYTGSGHVGTRFINRRDRFTLQNNTALETVHRLNIGGSSISPTNDSGMFRRWSDDTNFVSSLGAILANRTTLISFTAIPAYTAPKQVYQTARSIGKGMNLTWKLPVDPGFKYLLRLHFCELQPKIKKRGDRVFQIFIRNRIAEASADVITWTGGNGIPVYKDYGVMMQKTRTGKKSYLFVAVVPQAKSEPILNGLELFKINNTEGKLGGHNPEISTTQVPFKPPDHQAKKSKQVKTEFIAISGAVVISLLSVVGFIIFLHCKKARLNEESIIINPMPEGVCRIFTAEEIRNATNNFDRALVIGSGGFGRVYKGYVDGEDTPVAIKILNPTSSQGYREFRAEIEMLSKFRHPHLVSLIGYSNDERYMILVYDYMAHGTLRDHLYGTNNPPLPWQQRLEICIGAASGIHYLHAGAEHMIIHRDIKTSNILLDEKWVPKVSDFGLSRLGPTSLSRSHVTTVVKGTFGYLDPDYFHTNHLSEKSDVYSFGVVLFELICARPAVDMGLDEEQHSLVQWARQHVKNGTLDQIIDPNLRGAIAPGCLQVYGKIANKCLRSHRNERPTMSHVLKKLELALKLQETADAAAEKGIMIDGPQRERISLCGTGDRGAERAGDPGVLAHSCPTFWQKTTSHKEAFMFFSDKTRFKLAKPRSSRGLKALFYAIWAYKALPRDHEHSSDSGVCEQDLTSDKMHIEIINYGEQ